MVLVVFRIAILAASCLVPRDRAGWRLGWMCELQHYTTLLRARGLKNRYVRVRTWHHFIGAMRDAGRLFAETPAVVQLRSAIHTPGFCLGLIAAGLVCIAAASHGLAITRAMLAPPFPDAGRLVLISEGGVLQSERHAIPPPLFDFWRTHNTTLAGLAGFRWNSRGTAWVTPEFFDVLGVRPRSFLLHRIREWRPAAGPPSVGNALGVLGRLKPGVSATAAQSELRDLAARYWGGARSSPPEPAQVTPFVVRIRQPLYAYAGVCGMASALLLLAACIGMRTDRRRIGRIRRKYWAYFCAKSVSLPLALALVIWEFTRATSFTPAGRATFVAKPFFIWLVILACGAIGWWCLADQRARCRACLRTLQYPIRIGSLGAVLFDHAGTELMCCQGHGALYLPAVSSDYVQRGGWTALDAEDIASEPVPR
jgi:hypothetical protein